MSITGAIAAMIEEMLTLEGGTLEIGRNELASRIGCVPSQINYVISSRFTPERGYVIESRRGGGGYLRIIKKDVAASPLLMHIFASVGDELSEGGANALLSAVYEQGFMDEKRYRTAVASVSAAALARVPTEYKNKIRADIFRQIIMSLMR